MTRLSGLKIGLRLNLAFGVLIVLIVGLAGYGATSASRLARDLEATARTDLVRLRAAQALQQRTGTVARASREMLLTDSAGQLKKLKDSLTRALDDSNGQISRLAEQGSDPLVEAVRKAHGEFAQVTSTFVTALDAGNQDQARSLLLLELRPLQASYEKALDELTSAVALQTEQRASDGGATARLTVNAMTAAGLLGLGLAVFAAAAISRSITGPLLRATEVARSIQAGDLSTRIRSQGDDEIAGLLRSMDDMQQHLRKVIDDVLRAARDVAASSDELAHGNAELSMRTERAAGNLQQTATAVEQISTTAAGSSAKSHQASEVAGRAREAVMHGGTAVDKLVETMTRISGSSSRIRDIITVIDGIAFQTNILALNAAVEAARAGEQGRGFAVVAGEVRTLAARASAAAREIKQLIDDSAERVADGTSTVAEVGERIKGIVAEVMSVRQLIQEVSIAGQEQAAGMSSVNRSVTELDDSTQQNASLVEQIAATAASLKANAQRLVSTVEFFRLPDAQAAR